MNILWNHPLYFQNPAFVLQDVICVLEFLVMFSLTQISSALVCASVAGHKSWSLQCLINELRSGRHFFQPHKTGWFYSRLCACFSAVAKETVPVPWRPWDHSHNGQLFCFQFPLLWISFFSEAGWQSGSCGMENRQFWATGWCLLQNRKWCATLIEQRKYFAWLVGGRFVQVRRAVLCVCLSWAQCTFSFLLLL